MMLIPALLQAAASFQADAPQGTGLEWLTIAAIGVPAVVLVALVYWGAQETV
jgi:ABC-type arginine transport system permease subunit